MCKYLNAFQVKRVILYYNIQKTLTINLLIILQNLVLILNLDQQSVTQILQICSILCMQSQFM